MKYCKGSFFLHLTICLWGGLFFPAPLIAEEKQIITIVTPYPDRLSSTFQLAFENAHPGYQINFRNIQGTSKALSFVRNQQNTGVADIFWASSAEAFHTLKRDKKLLAFHADTMGIPDSISGVALHDAEHYFSGFALSGYGYMLNKRYLKAWHLPAPKRWSDLAQAQYHGHLAMSTPGLSGSTHTIIESILQGGKWRERWYLIKQIAGNMKQLIPKSYDVAKGVRDGEYAIGMTIDYYGLSMQATRYPVSFIYPERPALSAAYIGILQDAPNPEAARLFVNYLLSGQGQALLLDKNISRLPIRSDAYQQAPDNYPNPFNDEILKKNRIIDLNESKHRYQLVNILFDKLITFNFNELKAATKSIQCLEQALLTRKNDQAGQLLKLAENALSWVPFDEMMLEDEDYLAAFNQENLPEWDADLVAEEGIALEPQRWSLQAWTNYQQAKTLADQALTLIDRECTR